MGTELRSTRTLVALDHLRRASGGCAARNACFVPDESALRGVSGTGHGHRGCDRVVSPADQNGEHYGDLWSMLRTVPHWLDRSQCYFSVSNDVCNRAV